MLESYNEGDESNPRRWKRAERIAVDSRTCVACIVMVGPYANEDGPTLAECYIRFSLLVCQSVTKRCLHKLAL